MDSDPISKASDLKYSSLYGEEGHQAKKCDYIPLSVKLIEYIRSVDRVNDQELKALRTLMTQVGQFIKPDFSFESNSAALSDAGFRKYLEYTLKVHQIFALVNVDFGQRFLMKPKEQLSNFGKEQKFEEFAEPDLPEELAGYTPSYVTQVMEHYRQIAEQLKEHNGLNYVPRERSAEGRVFEHASDCRVLIDHLAQLKDGSEEEHFADQYQYRGYRSEQDQGANKQSTDKKSSFQSQEDQKDANIGQFFILLVDSNVASTADDEYRKHGDRLDMNDPLYPSSIDQRIRQELKIDHAQRQIAMHLKREFIDLSMKAKGKADLYFHAYFWQEYLYGLDDIQEKACLPRKRLIGGSRGGGTSPSSPSHPAINDQSDKNLQNEELNKSLQSPGKGQQQNSASKHSRGSTTADKSSGKKMDPNKAEEGKSDMKREDYISESPLVIDSSKVDLVSADQSKYPFMQRLIGLASTMQKVIANIKKFPFTIEKYNKYIRSFASYDNLRNANKKNKYLEEIQRALFVSQISDDKEALYLIEKLLIQLMGYCDIAVRDQAVVLLNMIYDEVDWQLQEAFKTTIRTIGQNFIINMNVQKTQTHQEEQTKDPEFFLALAAPSPIHGNNLHLVTWHKVEPRNIIEEDNISFTISINFGKFWKCGFFDWRLFEISQNGKFSPCEIIGQPDPMFPIVRQENVFNDYYDDDEQNIGSLAQGRFIVHAKGMREHTFHEIQVDYQNAQFDKNQNRFQKRGTFADVANSIDEYAQQGVTALYIMGTLARDNCSYQSAYSNSTEYKKDDASPLAVTSRSSANKMLGGEKGLQQIIQRAKSKNIKVIVDSVARICSSRHHRKYKDLLLHYLDEDGKRNICYGTDGQAQKFTDTAMLNYRKVESWDLLIDEIILYTSKNGIDGIHLDNGQAWPQIMEPDLDELQRLDIDDEPAYTPEELMSGEIVLRNENHGYWNTNVMETYPNPFFTKMCKKIWSQNHNFMIIGEAWGGFMFEHRQIVMARSGIIPRLYKLPMAISSLFGNRLYKDGRIQKCTPENVVAIKKWYDETRRFLPDGTILLQSSTSHSLPYPAHLYGRGTWAAIDILYFMPDIPITFMGEIDGEVYNIGQQTVFQHEQKDTNTEQSTGMKRSGSKILMALTMKDEDESTTTLENPSSTSGESAQGKGLIKVSSRILLASQEANIMDSTGQTNQITVKEQQFKNALSPSLGYDLSQIRSHYKHRRYLRQEKMVLRYGEIFFLTARENINGQNEWHEDVLCYARYSLMETCLIATNLSDKTKSFFIDASALMPTFRKAYANNTVVMVKDCINETNEPQYYFLREFLEQKEIKTLRPYRTSMVSLQIIDDDQYLFKKCLTNSIERMRKNIMSGSNIESEQISLLFSDCVENNPEDVERFANVIGSIQTSFLEKLGVQFDRMFLQNQKLTQSAELTSKLLAMSEYVVKNGRGDSFCPAVRAAQTLYNCNKLGKIVFATPELGRWSTVGGLGVMVDELSIGLAKLGQNVIVISPYYERNRKGQTGYLAQDPAGIRFVSNLDVNINGQRVTLGVHEGTVRDVKVVFLHNAEIFPSPYQGNGAGAVVYQLAVFNKAVLEYCCQREFAPSVCVTNDWFTGLVAAYHKHGQFGDYFKDTKFLHICHNLQETYEGRIHTNEDLTKLHGLPREWFCEGSNMINPSRCALINSDQWATVSKSYREELLQGSSLKHFLHQKPNPFAFPNGIPIGDRLKKLDAAAPDHMAAKRLLQKKYFKFGDLDDSVPLYAFVGRITSQKGVHLILDVAEGLITKFQYKIQFLVGGPANMGEPYAAQCAHKMWALKNKFPNCFWAAPEEFFTDGSLVNRGSDFGLMPSAFEPGGIVQHEFFVGKTPVIAFKTGGLKDSVHEFKWDSEDGSGFTMENHNAHELSAAIERANNTYLNKEKYQKLRENAFRATMEGEIVCKAWLNEFCRLTDKNFVDQRIIDQQFAKFKNPWNTQYYQPISIIQEIFGAEKRQSIFAGDIDQGATEKLENDIDYGSSPAKDADSQKYIEIDTIMSAFDREENFRKPHIFMLHNRGPRYQKVQLCGSMDEWKTRHEMQFDNFTNQWFITMHLNIGEKYHYKYIINEQHWVTNDEEASEKDSAGNQNNICGFYE